MDKYYSSGDYALRSLHDYELSAFLYCEDLMVVGSVLRKLAVQSRSHGLDSQLPTGFILFA